MTFGQFPGHGHHHRIQDLGFAELVGQLVVEIQHPPANVLEAVAGIHQHPGIAVQLVVAVAVAGVLQHPAFQVIHGLQLGVAFLAFLVLAGLGNERQDVQQFALDILVVPRMGQPLLGALSAALVHRERQPFQQVLIELLVVLGIQRQLVVDRHQDAEAVGLLGMALGGVVQGAVVLQQQLGGFQAAAPVHVEHQQVEAGNGIVLVAMAVFHMVIGPVDPRLLHQRVQLAEGARHT